MQPYPGMLACAPFNEQNKEQFLLSIITLFVLGKQNIQAKKAYSTTSKVKVTDNFVARASYALCKLYRKLSIAGQ